MRGPNVEKLIIHKMALDIVPPNSGVGIGGVVKVLGTPGQLAQHAKDAEAWVRQAIDAVKSADAVTNYYRNDDEIIAGNILAKIEFKKKFDAMKARTPETQ